MATDHLAVQESLSQLHLAPEDQVRRFLRPALNSRGDVQSTLHHQAAETRDAYLGRNVVMRAVIEVSNYCPRCSCTYCGMRRENRDLQRYRMQGDEILRCCKAAAECGIGTVMLQSGEDPLIPRTLVPLIPQLRDLGLHVILCIGEWDTATYSQLREAGADEFIIKFETSSADDYAKLRPHSTLERRIGCYSVLRALGYRVGTGSIVGLPNQDLDDIVEDLLLIRRLQPDMASTTPFVPNDQTPLRGMPPGSVETALNFMALARAIMPRALIPTTSALETVHPGGQLRGLGAGANVVTVNFTPRERRDEYAIYSSTRFIVQHKHALAIVKEAGLNLVREDDLRWGRGSHELGTA